MNTADDFVRFYIEGMETAARIVEKGGDAKAIREHAHSIAPARAPAAPSQEGSTHG